MLKATVYRVAKFLQVNMTLLTVLIIVASRFYHTFTMSFETAAAHAQLIEILSELSSSIPCVIASDRMTQYDVIENNGGVGTFLAGGDKMTLW